jgi:hypothetical protein
MWSFAWACDDYEMLQLVDRASARVGYCVVCGMLSIDVLSVWTLLALLALLDLYPFYPCHDSVQNIRRQQGVGWSSSPPDIWSEKRNLKINKYTQYWGGGR